MNNDLPPAKRINVISFNLLTPNYGTAKHFPKCDPNACDPIYRFEKIEQMVSDQIDLAVKNTKKGEREILPIFNFQEVSQKWYSKLVLFFKNKGYQIYYRSWDKPASGYMGVAIAYPRTSYILMNLEIVQPETLIPTSDRHRGAISGLSWYWKKAESWYNWVFNKRSIDDQWDRAKYKYNAGIWIKLRPNEMHDDESLDFCVGTYHMPCDYKRPTTMMLHTITLVKMMQDLSGNTPLILSGDFNFGPNSPYYQTITSGSIPDDFKFQRTNDDGRISRADQKIRAIASDLQPMKSSYFEKNGTEPLFTNYALTEWSNQPFSGCLDYVFYLGDLQVSKVIELPNQAPEEAFKTPLPTLDNPSDHLMIGANLYF